MTDTAPLQPAEYKLPASVISKVDVSHLVSELEWLDNQLTTTEVRAKAGATVAATPVTSGPLGEFLTLNKLDIGDSNYRSTLIRQLRAMKDAVPAVHMTFAVPADRNSLEQLTSWLRTEVHPQAVIAVGLQPDLVAGVYLRTPNHVHDLSLRAALKGGHGRLVAELEALRGTS